MKNHVSASSILIILMLAWKKFCSPASAAITPLAKGKNALKIYIILKAPENSGCERGGETFLPMACPKKSTYKDLYT